MPVVTLYNKVTIDGESVLLRTVLDHDRIRWENQDSISLNGMTIMANDNSTIYIPIEIEGYVKPKEYKSLADKTGKWTLQNEDIIVNELINDINPSVAELNRKYDEVRIIQSVDINDFAKTPILKHFEVNAK